MIHITSPLLLIKRPLLKVYLLKMTGRAIFGGGQVSGE